MPASKEGVSCYRIPKGGFTWKTLRQAPVAMNVGELIEQLKLLPPDLPIGAGTCGIDEGVKLVWYNIGESGDDCRTPEHLCLENGDDYEDDDDDEDEE